MKGKVGRIRGEGLYLASTEEGGGIRTVGMIGRAMQRITDCRVPNPADTYLTQPPHFRLPGHHGRGDRRTVSVTGPGCVL